MNTITKLLGGGDTGASAARAEAAAAQRRSLSQMAKDAAVADASGQRSGVKKGRQLLTFLGADGSGGLAA